eukprot:718402-Pelagomonas_calceolata.AAC.2
MARFHGSLSFLKQWNRKAGKQVQRHASKKKNDDVVSGERRVRKRMQTKQQAERKPEAIRQASSERVHPQSETHSSTLNHSASHASKQWVGPPTIRDTLKRTQALSNHKGKGEQRHAQAHSSNQHR